MFNSESVVVLTDELKFHIEAIRDLELEYENMHKGNVYLRKMQLLKSRVNYFSQKLKQKLNPGNISKFQGVYRDQKDGKEYWFEVYYPSDFTTTDIGLLFRYGYQKDILQLNKTQDILLGSIWNSSEI